MSAWKKVPGLNAAEQNRQNVTEGGSEQKGMINLTLCNRHSMYNLSSAGASFFTYESGIIWHFCYD